VPDQGKPRTAVDIATELLISQHYVGILRWPEMQLEAGYFIQGKFT
jgi:hypothetical protein